MNKEVVFIVEPHMDDGILGCVGFVLKNKDKYHYYLITVSRPSSTYNLTVRSQETVSVIEKLRGLGVTIDHILLENTSYQDGKLDVIGIKDILSDLEELSYTYRPCCLYLPYPSSHQDHRIVYETGIALSRVDYEHFIPNVYLYEPYLSTWSTTNISLGKRYTKLDSSELETKVETCSKYVSQVDDSSYKLYSIDSIIDLAKLRGRECNNMFAECHYIIREVY